jgi:xanthine dehydrogenase molybdopterin-binding subunit B
LWPVSQPIEKVEAKWQTAGEAEYVGDIPERKDELHGAFVLTSRANATVVSIDTTRALTVPGVVAFIDANDIPGANNWKMTTIVSDMVKFVTVPFLKKLPVETAKTAMGSTVF